MNQSINTDSKNSKEPQQKYRLGTVNIKILGFLNRFYRRPTSPSASTRRRTYVTSRDFNDRVHVLFLEILCDSGKTLFDISINTGQICMKFEADTPQKLLKYAHLSKYSDKKLI